MMKITMAMLMLSGLVSAVQQVANKERPVMKVVRMLQDMATELQKELEDDKQVHEMLTCWCETNEKEKKRGNRDGNPKDRSIEGLHGRGHCKDHCHEGEESGHDG